MVAVDVVVMKRRRGRSRRREWRRFIFSSFFDWVVCWFLDVEKILKLVPFLSIFICSRSLVAFNCFFLHWIWLLCLKMGFFSLFSQWLINLGLENLDVLAPHTVKEEEEVKTKGFWFITLRKFMALKSCEGELEWSPFHVDKPVKENWNDLSAVEAYLWVHMYSIQYLFVPFLHFPVNPSIEYRGLKLRAGKKTKKIIELKELEK